MTDDELDRIRAQRLAQLKAQVEGGTAPSTGPAETPVGVVDLDDASFANFVQKHDVVLVDFWAPWCGPCHAMAPAVEATAERWKGRAAVAKVNTDQNPATSRAFGIMSIPTTIVFAHGKPVKQLVGVQSGARLDQALTEAAGDRPTRERKRL